MVLAIVVPPVLMAIMAFYFLRSSKDMPKNWRELVIELKMQACGAQGLGEDILLRFRNKVGKLI